MTYLPTLSYADLATELNSLLSDSSLHPTGQLKLDITEESLRDPSKSPEIVRSVLRWLVWAVTGLGVGVGGEDGRIKEAAWRSIWATVGAGVREEREDLDDGMRASIRPQQEDNAERTKTDMQTVIKARTETEHVHTQVSDNMYPELEIYLEGMEQIIELHHLKRILVAARLPSSSITSITQTYLGVSSGPSEPPEHTRFVLSALVNFYKFAMMHTWALPGWTNSWRDHGLGSGVWGVDRIRKEAEGALVVEMQRREYEVGFGEGRAGVKRDAEFGLDGEVSEVLWREREKVCNLREVIEVVMRTREVSEDSEGESRRRVEIVESHAVM